MNKRRKATLADDLLDLLALLPWWACVLLAGISHVVLRRVAAPVPVAGAPDVMVQSALLYALTTIGQYFVPLFCLMAAALSAWHRKQRQRLVTDVAQARSTAALDGMTWREFEMLVGEAFRLRGYRVAETGGGGPDGGVDLVLTTGGEKFLVQCKQWKAYKVGVDVVRALFGVMAARGATGGFVVTSGRFTADARDFAQGRNIELIDGPRLFAMIQQARRAQSLPLAPQAEPIAATTATSGTAQSAAGHHRASADAPPACPRCGTTMTLRTARQGAHAGNMFWGCTAYPACRGTRSVEPSPAS